MNRYCKLSFLVVALAAVGSVAYAAKAIENDAMTITKAKISLVQAVTTAEQHLKGKATRAEYEQDKQGWVYDIEVVSEANVFDVKVDATTGKLMSSVEDNADDEADDSKDDDAHEHHGEHGEHGEKK
jgi:Peptidase propeptide and YPEB domain